MRAKLWRVAKVLLLIVASVIVLGDVFMWTLAPMTPPKGPAAGRVGEPLSFKGKVKYDPFQAHIGQWDFGDDARSDWERFWRRRKDPAAQQMRVIPWRGQLQTHTYSAPGTYHVRWRGRCPWWLFIQPWSDELTVTICAPASG